MDYQTARDNLINLLCCSVEALSITDLRKLVKKRYLQWHPDKNKDNPERFVDNFRLLKESFDVYVKGPPTDSGCFFSEDLHCDEEWDPSWDSDESDYNSTPFDDDFFHASPKKNFAVPEELRLFFRSKTNRRAGKVFMLFTFSDSLHRQCLEKFSKDDFIQTFYMFAGRTNKEIYACLILTHLEIRLLDLKKRARGSSLKTCEVFYSVNKFKLLDKLYDMYKEPVYTSGPKLEKSTKEETNFNNKQLVDFALSHEITDIFKLMYEYAHLADPCDRPECSKDHEDDHISEVINAKRFVLLPDRKKVCRNAIDCVSAKVFTQLSQLSNLKWFEIKARELGDRITEISDTRTFGEAYYWWQYVIGRQNFFNIMAFIIAIFTDTKCKLNFSAKKRYICFRGPYNCGKTTMAAAICKLFDGVNINLNVSKDRLPFYIGSAIGKRFVLFDDVKGYENRHNLPTGTGVSNLDDMREHLDGKIEVQLEKKNQNPVQQIFPSGIITMNQYKLPNSLKIRLNVIDFLPCPMYKKHRYLVTPETIYIAMALDNLIPAEEHVLRYIARQKDRWLQEHTQGCSCIQVSMGLVLGTIASSITLEAVLEFAADAAIAGLGLVTYLVENALTFAITAGSILLQIGYYAVPTTLAVLPYIATALPGLALGYFVVNNPILTGAILFSGLAIGGAAVAATSLHQTAPRQVGGPGVSYTFNPSEGQVQRARFETQSVDEWEPFTLGEFEYELDTAQPSTDVALYDPQGSLVSDIYNRGIDTILYLYRRREEIARTAREIYQIGQSAYRGAQFGIEIGGQAIRYTAAGARQVRKIVQSAGDSLSGVGEYLTTKSTASSAKNNTLTTVGYAGLTLDDLLIGLADCQPSCNVRFMQRRKRLPTKRKMRVQSRPRKRRTVRSNANKVRSVRKTKQVLRKVQKTATRRRVRNKTRSVSKRRTKS